MKYTVAQLWEVFNVFSRVVPDEVVEGEVFYVLTAELDVLDVLLGLDLLDDLGHFRWGVVFLRELILINIYYYWLY